MKNTPNFDYSISAAQEVSIGMCRYINQDETIICKEASFYGVTDGIGGFKSNGGGKTSILIKEEMPVRMIDLLKRWKEKVKTASSTKSQQEYAAEMLSEEIARYSDFIFYDKNSKQNMFGKFDFKYGATLSGVWLTGGHYAIFTNIGDSRGYLLRKADEKIIQITTDHNVAAEMVQAGTLTKEEARYHHKACQITRFMGMEAPAVPDVFIEEVCEGDRILLCSDGLYGMVDDDEITKIMRSSEDPKVVCERLVEKANYEGGQDNIAVVCLMIQNLSDKKMGKNKQS